MGLYFLITVRILCYDWQIEGFLKKDDTWLALEQVFTMALPLIHDYPMSISDKFNTYTVNPCSYTKK